MTASSTRAHREDAEISPEQEAAELLSLAGVAIDQNPDTKNRKRADGQLHQHADHSGQSNADETAASSGDTKSRQEPPNDRDQSTFTRSQNQDTTSEIDPDFRRLGLSGKLLESIQSVGYEAPTDIQVVTIPAMLAGRDVIAQAQTGSGKTAAFGLPIIDNIDATARNVQALVLTPTRELAIQVAEALHKYGHHNRVETLPIYGGQSYDRQFRGLKRGPQIIVGTPGRVMDHIRRGTLDLAHVHHVVLDEADEMLDMGFIEDIEWILDQAPSERQTALFSATMPHRITLLAKKHLDAPEHLRVRGKEMTVPETRQTYFEVPRSRKIDALTRVLDAESPPSAMIFCRTKIGVDELGEALLARGYEAETLHGDLSQAQRDRVMRRFRTGQADILVATDVAARGLDIPEVSHVFNFDPPQSAEAYVHRIGRTGRAGRAGVAVTFVTAKERRWLKQIERITKATIERQPLPTAADVADRRREGLKSKVADIVSAEEVNALYLGAIEELSEEFEISEVAAALLRMYAEETGRAIVTADSEDELAAVISRQSGKGEPGMTQLFINIGKNFNVRPKDVVGAIANEAGIPGKTIGAIEILDTFTFVDVPSGDAPVVIDALNLSGIKGKDVNAEVSKNQASPREHGGQRGRRPWRRSGSRAAGPRRGKGGNRQYRGNRH